MRYSFHYLSFDTESVLAQIANKEKRAIRKYYADLKNDNMFESEPWCNMYTPMPCIDKTLEHIIVKVWANIISVYPMDEHWGEYVPWSMFDIRRKGNVHKYGSIIVTQEANLFLFGLVIYGKYVAEKEVVIDISLIGSADLTIQQYAPKEMLQALCQVDMRLQSGGLDLEIPILLPATWKENWTVYKQTQFITFCK